VFTLNYKKGFAGDLELEAHYEPDHSVVHPIGDASGLAQPGMYNPNAQPIGSCGIVYPTNEVVNEDRHD
jgi:hypothetical protein